MFGRMTRGWLAACAALVCPSLWAIDPQLADALEQAPRWIVHPADTPEAGSASERLDPQAQVRGLSTQLGLTLSLERQLGTGSLLVRLPDHADSRTISAAIQRLDAVMPARFSYVEPDRLMQANTLPDDPDAANLWGLAGPPEGSTAGVNALTAWTATRGAGATVAIIDTGYRPHADLVANVVGGYDFISDTTNANDGGGRDADASDPGDWRNAGECGSSSSKSSSWHGTHVGGTVAAIADNRYGVAGVAPQASLVMARVLGKCGGYTSDISDAITWTSGGTVSGVPANTHPAQVLNMSLGGQYPCSSSPETQNAINGARGRGAVVVVAAGNSNLDASGFSPASCSGVVTVAAVNQSGARSYYSNYGATVDVAAPGGETTYGTIYGIESTLNSGTTTPGADTFAWYQGTSMATPHVSGVVALMKALAPDLTPDSVESILKSSVRSFPSACSGCGAGLVDAAKAVDAVIGGNATPLPIDTLVQDIAGTAGSSRMYVLTVPNWATDLDIALTPGSGTAALYVRRGTIPTTSSYDCAQTDTGSGVACNFPGPVTAGAWYVMVVGVTDYSGYTLYATHASNPPGALSFSQASFDVGEAGGSATISVTRTGGSAGAVGVSYATSNGTAASGTDYTAKSGTLSWAAGDTATKTFTVPITNDTAPEATETIKLALSKPTGSASLGALSNATINIRDNDSDPGVLQFTVTALTVAESTATVTLTASRTAGKYGTVGVSFATVGDATATSGSDFVARTGTLIWANGDTANKTFTVSITNDAIAESTETFGVQLSAPTGGATLGTNTRANVSITDNDGAPGTLAFSAASFAGSESAGFATVTVNRAGGSGGAVSVAYATSGGTATVDMDYTATSGTLSWEASDPAPKTITIPIADDSLWETTSETIGLTLSAPTGGATLGTQKTATVSITDNDNTPGTLQFALAGYTVSEATASITVSVTRTGGNAGAVGVSYATASDSATAGADFTAKSGTLSWTNGDSAAKTFSVSIINDLYAESTESIALALSDPSNGASLGAMSTSAIAITDNDSAPGSFAFSAASFVGSEASGLATVTVNRTGGSGGAVSVNYSTSNGTAAASTDFTTASGTLSWDAADPTPKTFTVPITDDTVWEASETINLALSSPTGGATLGTQKTATVSITDNDNNPGTLQYSLSSFSVSEATASATITVTRSGGNSGTVGVSYAAASGTATAGSDFTAKSGSLSWANGDTANKTFTVSITNDLYAESTETVALTLANPTGGAVLGANATAELSVTDNDSAPGSFVFSAASFTGSEASGLATVTVNRTGGSGGAVSVNYSTSNGTAAASTDFTTASGTLSWDAADPTPKTFTVPITDDTVWEASETINLALSSPTGGATLGTQKTATVSITDNDNNPGTLQFALASTSISESATSITISVTRTGGSAGTVGVSYATVAGTAGSGDFTGKTGSLSWSSGTTGSKTFTVTLKTDTIDEPNETFDVVLSSPTAGAVLGSVATMTVTILDNN